MKHLPAFIVGFCISTPCHVAAKVFGPGRCVSISQSPQGSCVLATNCDGQNTSKFEFAFNCELPRGGGVIRHSFGNGGFDDNEQFDTGVICDRCSPPSPSSVLAVSPPKPSSPMRNASLGKKKQLNQTLPSITPIAPMPNPQTRAGFVQQATAAAPAPPHIAELSSSRYGPNNCVSVRRSKEGHCVMKTNCTAADISGYIFGLVCVDAAGTPVRHLFGKDSFDPKETFDTLISCDQCLGQDNVPREVAVSGQVVALTKEIEDMKRTMLNLTQEVSDLSAKLSERDRSEAAKMVQHPPEAMTVFPPVLAVTPNPSELKPHSALRGSRPRSQRRHRRGSEAIKRQKRLQAYDSDDLADDAETIRDSSGRRQGNFAAEDSELVDDADADADDYDDDTSNDDGPPAPVSQQIPPDDDDDSQS